MFDFDFKPAKIEIAEISEDKKYGRFVVEPLERGYGTTLGNSLRRIMLSSLPGSAVSQVRIDGVVHEFSGIPGVKEDVTEIIMNIKSLAIKNTSATSEPKTAYIEYEGEGVVTAAEDIADYILPDGKDIVSFKGKGIEDSTDVSRDRHQLDMPMAVLVNGQSASASEILSGALGYHDAAVIVGTKTFGKGIAQGMFSIPDGSALKLTTAYYYLPSGECIHEKGIEPDVEVELLEELETMVEIPKEKDNQLQAAIAVLLEGEDVVKERLEAEKKALEEIKESETVEVKP